MTEIEKQMLVSEVNLLRELKHPHIVRYYDRILDRSTTTIYIIMEFCEGGDLGALIAKHRKEKWVIILILLASYSQKFVNVQRLLMAFINIFEI